MMRLLITACLAFSLSACTRSAEEMERIGAAANRFATSLGYTVRVVRCVDRVSDNARCSVRVSEMSVPFTLDCWCFDNGTCGCMAVARGDDEKKKRKAETDTAFLIF